MQQLLFSFALFLVYTMTASALYWTGGRVECKENEQGALCVNFDAIWWSPPLEGPPPLVQESEAPTSLGSNVPFPSPVSSSYPTTPNTSGATLYWTLYNFVAKEFEGKYYSYDPLPITTVELYLTYSNTCKILVDGEECNACQPCGITDYKEEYTFDCTNVPFGRQTSQCESGARGSTGGEFLSNFFFPLTSESPAVQTPRSSAVPSLVPAAPKPTDAPTAVSTDSPVFTATPSVVSTAAPSLSPSTQLPSGDLQEDCVPCTDTPPHWFPDNYSCGGSDWRRYVRNNCWRNKWRGNDWCTYSCATKWNKIQVQCCSQTLSTLTGSPATDAPTITSTNTPTAAPVISNTVSPMQPSVSSPSPSVAPSIFPSPAPSVVPTAAPSVSPSTQLPSGDLQEDCVPCTDTPPHWFPANYSCAGSDWRGYVRNNCWRNKWRGNDWCTFSCATKWNKIEVNCCDPTSGRRHLRETQPALNY